MADPRPSPHSVSTERIHSRRLCIASAGAPFLLPSALRLSLTLARVRLAKMVQEYLRRIIEACLVSASEGAPGGARQLGGKAAGGAVPGAVGAKGAASRLPTSLLYCEERQSFVRTQRSQGGLIDWSSVYSPALSLFSALPTSATAVSKHQSSCHRVLREVAP